MSRELLPPISSQALTAFASVAAAYCQLIESHKTLTAEQLASGVLELLPRVYSAGMALPSTDVLFSDEDDDEDSADLLPENHTSDPDRGTHEEHAALFRALNAKLGLRSSYREVFDPYEPDTTPEVVGSLSDDFADIYRDLQSGLLKWRRGESGEALWEWRFNFEFHWGEHATSALRALHTWASTYDLPWPRAGPPRSEGAG